MMPRVSAGMRLLSRNASDTVLVENPVFAAISLSRTTPLPKPSPTLRPARFAGAGLHPSGVVPALPGLLHQDPFSAQPLNGLVLQAVRRHFHELDAVAVRVLEPGLPVAVDGGLERQQEA